MAIMFSDIVSTNPFDIKNPKKQHHNNPTYLLPTLFWGASNRKQKHIICFVSPTVSFTINKTPKKEVKQHEKATTGNVTGKCALF